MLRNDCKFSLDTCMFKFCQTHRFQSYQGFHDAKNYTKLQRRLSETIICKRIRQGSPGKPFWANTALYGHVPCTDDIGLGLLMLYCSRPIMGWGLRLQCWCKACISVGVFDDSIVSCLFSIFRVLFFKWLKHVFCHFCVLETLL